MFEATNITKHYKQKCVLDNVSLTLIDGEIVGLVGKNGAGKSTLLHILATLLQPDSGVVSLDGQTTKATLRKHIGFVPQQLALWDDLSVKENMQFFERLSWQQHDTAQLRSICESMALTAWEEPVHTLSGGMKRKLNLAIALIQKPRLLLLDEPTVGIDLKSKLDIAEALKMLAAKGTMILYISHDLDELRNVCHRIISLGDDDFYYTLLQGTTTITKL